MSDAGRSPRLSTPTRIFLAFAVCFAAFVALLLWSVQAHQRTAQSLRLLEEGYVPLAITVGEAKATQSLFATLLDRVLNEEDPTATRHWLNTARKLRPTTIRRSLYNIERAFRLGPEPADEAALTRVREEVRFVEKTYAGSEAKYDALFAALATGRKPDAQRLLRDLQDEERAVRDRLRLARDVIETRLASFSKTTAEREQQTTLMLAVLTAVAMLLAALVTWWSQRVLGLLPKLKERVLAVAAGDFSSRLEVRTADELGEVAREFERMVEALLLRDTRLREAHREQIETRAQLTQSERMAAIGKMAAHVTHEVRNPLSSMRLNVELLEEDLRDASQETRGILVAIHREIDRLAAISDEYLKLARLPAPRLERTDLAALVRDVAQFVDPEMASTGLRLEVDAALGAPVVLADEQQLRQVLLNLLRNAREAMPGGGAVRLAVRAEDGGAVLLVCDQGPGVPAALRGRLFDVFFTTKEQGSGLGLSLTQQIVQAHGGRIEYGDAPGGGAEFRVWLPAATPPSDDEREAA